MREISSSLFALAILALPILANPALADQACGPLVRTNSIQMTRAPGTNLDLVPVRINGAARNFVFSTGAVFTEVRRATIKDLNLPVGQSGTTMINGAGKITNEVARVEQFRFGHMRGDNVLLHEPPGAASGVADGIFAADYFAAYDTDVDFGTDVLNFFSPDHCPGDVVYWKPQSVAAIPMTRKGLRVLVAAQLDGQDVEATVDTGAAVTSLRSDVAQRLWNVTLGAPDTPQRGSINGDAGLKLYTHRFHSLTLAGVTVNNPEIALLPTAMNAREEQLIMADEPSEISRALSGGGSDLTLGMDVLRKLHLYFAFKEGQLYVSPASGPQAARSSPPAAPQ